MICLVYPHMIPEDSVKWNKEEARHPFRFYCSIDPFGIGQEICKMQRTTSVENPSVLTLSDKI